MGEYREASLASWEASAPGWARWSDRLDADAREVTDRLLAGLDPRPGETILELSAGRGDVGFEAASRLGEGGRLITSDFSPVMVEHARQRAEELGVENADFRVTDAERIDLEDDSVDGVVCRYGYMLLADPAAALAETRRVLRPGGRLAFATWGPAERNPWGGLLGRILVERGHMPPPGPGRPGIFALPDPDGLEELTRQAGFERVTAEEIEFSLAYGDADGHWDFLVSAAGAVAGILASLPQAERASVRRELEERVRPLVDRDDYALPAVSLVAAAT